MLSRIKKETLKKATKDKERDFWNAISCLELFAASCACEKSVALIKAHAGSSLQRLRTNNPSTPNPFCAHESFTWL